MKKYTVEVNSTDYEVIIKDEGEEVNKETQIENTAATTESNNTEDMVAVEAPMTGTILSIKADKGDIVNQGETIMTLEAMKMETEISAPVSGEIGAIKVKEGDHCENGKVIALIKEAG